MRRHRKKEKEAVNELRTALGWSGKKCSEVDVIEEACKMINWGFLHRGEFSPSVL